MGNKISIFIKTNYSSILITLSYFILPFLFYYNVLSSSGVLAPGDGFVSYVPIRKFLADAYANLHFPLWNSNLISGSPFLADIQAAVLYPPNLIFAVFPFEFAYNLSILFHFSLAGLFTYLYLRSVKLNKKAAFLGGVVFMFSAALTARQGQVTIQNAIVWLPLILYFYEKLIGSRKKKYVVLMSIAFVFQIFSGFIQITVYTSIILAIYFIFSLKKYPSVRQWLIDKVNFSLIALGLASLQLLPTIVLTQYVGRQDITYDIFGSYSLPLKSLVTIFYPFFYGIDTPTSLYEIPSFTLDGNVGFGIYVGIIPALFALTIIVNGMKKEKHVLVMTVIATTSLLLSLGSSIPFLNNLMYEVPLYNMFRVPARFIFGFDFSIAVLFAIQLHRIIKNPDILTKINKKIILICSFIIGMVVFSFFIIKIISSILVSDINADKVEMILDNFSLKNPAFIIPTLLMLLYILLLLIYRKLKHKKVIQWIFAFLLLLDLHSYSFHYANIIVNTEKEELAKYVEQNIQQGERIWPVLDSYATIGDFGGLLPNRNMYYGINSINGYVTFLPNNYKSLLHFDERGVNSHSLSLLENNYILSSLNTRYIIANRDKDEFISSTKLYDLEKTSPIHTVEHETIIYDNQVGYGIYQETVDVKPNTMYKISAELKKPTDKLVYVDLYGENYDNDEQQLYLLNGNETKFVKIINSGPDAPQDVKLRIISTDIEPVEVREVKFELLTDLESDKPPYEVMYQDNNYTVYENNFVVDKFYGVAKMSSADNISAKLYETNLLTTALVEGLEETQYFNIPEITKISYADGYGKAEVHSPENSFIVFSEHFYPGWRGYIDGQEVDIQKVNGLTMGIEIPAGDHTVEFKYKPREFYVSVYILLGTILYIVLYLYSSKVLRIVRRKSSSMQ